MAVKLQNSGGKSLSNKFIRRCRNKLEITLSTKSKYLLFRENKISFGDEMKSEA